MLMKVFFRRFARVAFLVCWGGLGVESAFAVTGDNFNYNGYMRSGSGSNFNGASQQCFHQQGTPGNEFRLGNECGTYGEAYFQAYTDRSKDVNGEFFRANFDLSYNPQGNTVTQAPNLYVFGAYVEAGRLDGGPETFWVGRRFYRDSDIHIDDFFYFADTSGSGAGVQDIPIAGAKGHFAIMMQDTDQKNVVTVNGQTQTLPAQTENGRPRTVLFDGRLFDINLSKTESLNIWAGFAMVNGGGQDVNTGQTFPAARGEVLGLKYHVHTAAGYNNLAVIHGRGLMQGMNLGGYFGADPAQLLNGQAYHDSAHRTRMVDELVFQISPHFATAFAAIYETWNLGADAQSGRWASVGARPTYFFGDHYSVAFEAGVSNVRQSSANPSPSTPLIRATIAPQISPRLDFFSRPVLRLFVTDTFTQSKGAGYGFQGEVWF
jgi:maltoporin